MKHIFQKGKEQNKRTLLLLHGTGGNEYDLLPIAEKIDADASILSVRGDIKENGMARYFKRISEGVFDEEDLILQTNKLNEFLFQASEQYDFDRNEVIAIGYSNGANIAASLLFHIPQSLKGAILHHPMVPRRGIKLPDLSGTRVFMSAGRNDPLCPPEETKDLQTLLTDAKASVYVYWGNMGHQLVMEEIDAAHKWYNQMKK